MKIKLGNCQLEQCREFVYLEGNITKDTSCNKDVDRRIGLAVGIVRSLQGGPAIVRPTYIFDGNV